MAEIMMAEMMAQPPPEQPPVDAGSEDVVSENVVSEDVVSEDAPSTGGNCFRFFFPRELSEPLILLKLRTVESSFAPSFDFSGSSMLLFVRGVSAALFSTVGVAFGLTEDWDMSRMHRPGYLHNWGSIAVAVYYIVAFANSADSFASPSIRTQPLSRWRRWLTSSQILLFELSLVLETLMIFTFLYRTLERGLELQPGSSLPLCGALCLMGYVLTFLALMFELVVSRMPIHPRHVFITILYPILWVLWQTAWVYTDHPPTYPGAITFRNMGSITWVVVGLVAFGSLHQSYWILAEKRDSICEGRYYPVNEGKETIRRLP